MLTLRFSATTIVRRAAFAVALLMAVPVLHAQSESIPQTIESAYVMTKPTADLTGIVKPGDVLVLQKDNLFMCQISSAIPSYNKYKNGEIKQSLLNGMKFFTASGNTPTVQTRTFVAGEKVFLIGVDMLDDGVRLSLLSGAYNGIHYKAFLVFPFPKNRPPAAAQVLQSVAQVLSIEDAPKEQPVATSSRTIAIGQSKEQVLAILGQPTTVVQLGAGREIDYFPAMKVTFVDNHVANVQ